MFGSYSSAIMPTLAFIVVSPKDGLRNGVSKSRMVRFERVRIWLQSGLMSFHNDSARIFSPLVVIVNTEEQQTAGPS